MIKLCFIVYFQLRTDNVMATTNIYDISHKQDNDNPSSSSTADNKPVS